MTEKLIWYFGLVFKVKDTSDTSELQESQEQSRDDYCCNIETLPVYSEIPEATENLVPLPVTVGDSSLSGRCMGPNDPEQVPGTWMCGDALDNVCYQLNSTRLIIRETTFTEGQCCTDSSGLGCTVSDMPHSHQAYQMPAGNPGQDLCPMLGQGIMTRTVCLNWKQAPCFCVYEMKFKKGTNYFQLKPLQNCAACSTGPEPPNHHITEGPPTVESTDRSSSVALEATTLRISTIQKHEDPTTPKYTDDSSNKLPALSTSESSESSETHITEESSPVQSTDPPSVTVEATTLRISTIQKHEDPTIPKYTDDSSNKLPALSTSESSESSETHITEESSPVQSTDPPSVTVEATTLRISTIQKHEDPTTPKYTDDSSNKLPALSTSESSESSETHITEESSPVQSTDPPSVTVEATTLKPELSKTHQTEEPTTMESANRPSSVAVESKTLSAETSTIQGGKELTTPKYTNMSSGKPTATSTSEPELSKTHQTEEPTTMESTDRPSSVAVESKTLSAETSTIQGRNELTTPKYTNMSSGKPTATSTSEPELSKTHQTEEPTTMESTDRPSSVAVESKTLSAETSTIQGLKELTTPKYTNMSSGKPTETSTSEPELSKTHQTEEPTTMESTDRPSSVAVESKTLSAETSTIQGRKESTTPKYTNMSSEKPTATSTSEPELSKTHQTEEPTTMESTNRPSSVAVESKTLSTETSTIQGRKESTTPKYTNMSSGKPTETSTSEPELSKTHKTEEPTTMESTNRPSSVAVESKTQNSGRSTKPGKVETTQRDAECKQFDGTYLTPGLLDISDEDCEEINAEVLVMHVGKTKLENTEKMKAHLRQVQDMLKGHLPCKKLV
ncbi:mucin-5AC-like [Scyliorhinus canicula]|uniref:mucin-5AC-like n=1 Tax=Scyliorhinus canicula TaxID=7830 RepID=UPI0018F64B08|nr:mucin-5AC-like [Scyliorhinus canicula]